MIHARADYDAIQDASAAVQLAELVMSMQMATDAGKKARDLARQVLGVQRIWNDRTIAIRTNGTTRFIPADEPVFLVRGQDIVGGAAVRAWADLAAAQGAAPDILKVAREHAEKMDAWPVKKTPDLPK
jgi:hypothetical protein